MNRREVLLGGSLAGLGLASGVAAQEFFKPTAAAAAGPLLNGADILLTNARIMTLDPRSRIAQAALVRKGKIVAVGSHAELRGQARGVQEFDTGGRTVIPGFVDNHCHVEDSCIVGDHQPTLSGTPTIAQMIDKVRARAATVPKGEWVLMQASPADFPNGVAEKRWLSREDLDKATEDHPVMVVLGIHASIMNTRAWKQTGYWDPNNDRNVKWPGDGQPRMGSVIHRDAEGRPVGLATEVWDFRPGYTVEQYKQSMRNHFKDWFLSKGLTSITTLQDTAPNEFLALQELQQEGGLPARLRVYPIAPHAIGVKDLRKVGWRTGFGDDMFRYGGVKFFVDGIGTDFMGKQVYDPKWTLEGLTEALTDCQRGGIQTIMHVVNDQGWDLALDALEAAKRAAPGELKHRIDHRTPDNDAIIERARRLGVVCGITAPRMRPTAGPSRGGWGRDHRYKTLAAKNMMISVLDAAGPGGMYHPLQGVANMISERSQGGSAPPGEALTLEQALRSWTLWPAEANFEGHQKGTIEVGKLGDFTILSEDPAGKSAAAIYDITTPVTILGGNVVYGG
jgi:predicted amidohydrolase YtcJ